jgi:tetratricopeptide (TPR) repeat protein
LALTTVQSRILGALALLGALAVGYGALGFGNPAGNLDARLAEGERLLAEGALMEAEAVADAVAEGWPERAEGHLLGVRVYTALHHRRQAEQRMEAAYARAPSGFPRLPLYMELKLQGADQLRKGTDALAFLDGHLARFPSDVDAVNEGRLVVYAYMLGQATLPEVQRAALRVQAEAALQAFRVTGPDTTERRYNEAQVRLALGDLDGAIAAGRAGIAADTDRWTGLVLHWAIATALLHHGRADEAWAEMEAIQSALATWPGTHFGMGKPLVELMQLTTQVRYGRTLAAPAEYEARLARLEVERVRLQDGDPDTRRLIRELLVALPAGDEAKARADVDDLLLLVERDHGCEMENQLIRPHARAMLLVTRGDVLTRAGDAAGAQAAYAQAAALFPQDAWRAGKAGATGAAGATTP